MSLRLSRFGNNLNLIYSNELEEINDAHNSASDPDLRVEIENGGILKAKRNTTNMMT